MTLQRVLLVAMALDAAAGPLAVRAQAPMARAALYRTGVSASPTAGAVPSAELEGHRRTLLAEIEEWKVFLPDTQPPDAVTQHRRPVLHSIKASAETAGTEPELAETRRRFEEWKTGLAHELYPGAEDIAETLKNALVMIRSLRALAADDADRRTLEGLKSQAASGPMDARSLARLFENIGTFAPTAKGPQTPPGSSPTAAASSGAPRQDPYARIPEKGLKINDVPEVVPASLPFVPNTRLGRTILELVYKEARRQGIDPLLVLAVMKAESSFNPNARSRVWNKREKRWEPGAVGLMQIMPATGRGMGYSLSDLWSIPTNIRAGIQYLRDMWTAFQDMRKAVAAYNAGPGAVKRYGGVPPYRETRGYVVTVLRNYSELRRHYGWQVPQSSPIVNL